MIGLEGEVLDAIHGLAKLEQFGHGEVMIRQGDVSKGIYIIVFGLVKVCACNNSCQCLYFFFLCIW